MPLFQQIINLMTVGWRRLVHSCSTRAFYSSNCVQGIAGGGARVLLNLFFFNVFLKKCLAFLYEELKSAGLTAHYFSGDISDPSVNGYRVFTFLINNNYIFKFKSTVLVITKQFVTVCVCAEDFVSHMFCFENRLNAVKRNKCIL